MDAITQTCSTASSRIHKRALFVNLNLFSRSCRRGFSSNQQLFGLRDLLHVFGTHLPQAFNDPMLLPGPADPGVDVDEPGRLHAQHPAMLWRKLRERPFSELQGSRKHSENVYGSTLENYCPTAWNTLAIQEPLLPTRRHNGP